MPRALRCSCGKALPIPEGVETVVCSECGKKSRIVRGNRPPAPPAPTQPPRPVAVSEKSAPDPRPEKTVSVAAPQPPGLPSEACKYFAFLSYRHGGLDEKWTAWLHRQLESFPIPSVATKPDYPRPSPGAGAAGRGRRTDRMYPVFRDKDELGAASHLSEAIREKLRESEFLIVCCTPRTPMPNSEGKNWVEEEIRYFRDELGRGNRILAMLIDGEPAQAFPGVLTDLEPLAIDLRPFRGIWSAWGTGRRKQVTRLAATILGLGFDEVYQRVARQRRRRQLLWGSVVSVLLVVIAGLGWNTLQQSALTDSLQYKLVDTETKVGAVQQSLEQQRSETEAERQARLAEEKQRQEAEEKRQKEEERAETALKEKAAAERAREEAKARQLLSEDSAGKVAYAQRINDIADRVLSADESSASSLNDKQNFPPEMREFTWRYLNALAANRSRVGVVAGDGTPRQTWLDSHGFCDPAQGVSSPNGELRAVLDGSVVKLLDAQTGVLYADLTIEARISSSPVPGSIALRFIDNGHKLMWAGVGASPANEPAKRPKANRTNKQGLLLWKIWEIGQLKWWLANHPPQRASNQQRNTSKRSGKRAKVTPLFDNSHPLFRSPQNNQLPLPLDEANGPIDISPQGGFLMIYSSQGIRVLQRSDFDPLYPKGGQSRFPLTQFPSINSQFHQLNRLRRVFAATSDELTLAVVEHRGNGIVGIALWDLQKGRITGSLSLPEGGYTVPEIAFSADSRFLTAVPTVNDSSGGSGERFVRFRVRDAISLTGIQGPLGFTEDGSRLIARQVPSEARGKDKETANIVVSPNLGLWDIRRGSLVSMGGFVPPKPQPDKHHSVSSVESSRALRPSPVLFHENWLRFDDAMYDWDNGSPHRIEGAYGAVNFIRGPRAAYLAGSSKSGNVAAGEIRILDLRSGEIAWKVDLTESPPSLDLPVAPIPDDAAASANESRLTPLDGASGRPQSMTISDDGRFVACGAFIRATDRAVGPKVFDGESVVVVWDTQTNERREIRCSGARGLKGMHLSFDGSRLSTLHSDGVIRQWHPETGEQKAIIDIGSNSESEFAPDGKSFLIKESGSVVGLWSCDVGRRVSQFVETDLQRIADATGPVCAYAPDGRTLVVAIGTQIRLVEPISGLLLLTLSEKIENLRELAFSPDGTMFAALTSSGTVHVWSAIP